VYRIDVYPAKAMFKPGEIVQFMVESDSPIDAEVRLSISYLASVVATLSAPVSLTTASQSAAFDWQPPATAPRGYGVDVELLDRDGTVIAVASTAFDVLERWTQAPRYGFLTDFSPGRDKIDETLRTLLRYHVNGLQFYDWMYRHDQLLPPTDDYRDPLDRPLSLTTLRALIDSAHRHGIAAMPYTAIYAASPEFARLHPDWALFRADGQPFEFAGGFLIYMNPAGESPWRAHLLDQFEAMLRTLDFDGVHVDQYGDPIAARDASGDIVALEQTFASFVDAAAERVHALRGSAAVVFNCVANWPIESVARSRADFMYVEVWKPDTSWRDLWRIIVEAQHLSHKPVVLAAYIDPVHEHNVRLADAIIFASGGYHVEMGESGGLLADPYFPKYGCMSEALANVLRAYYDFAVRYENVLALGTRDATSDWAGRVSIDGVSIGPHPTRDTVWPIVREGDGFACISLINLLGLESSEWTEALPDGPTPLGPITVHVRSDKIVAKAWWASPDSAPDGAASGGSMRLAPAPIEPRGDDVAIQLPGLAWWTLILLEWER
jgi:dextranase